MSTPNPTPGHGPTTVSHPHPGPAQNVPNAPGRGTPPGAPARGRVADHDDHDRRPRLSTETKASVKTTELMAYLAAVIAVVITAIAVGGDGEGDPFGAGDAIRYITFLTIGYMIARGLAKSGSRDHYDG